MAEKQDFTTAETVRPFAQDRCADHLEGGISGSEDSVNNCVAAETGDQKNQKRQYYPQPQSSDKIDREQGIERPVPG